MNEAEIREVVELLRSGTETESLRWEANISAGFYCNVSSYRITMSPGSRGEYYIEITKDRGYPCAKYTAHQKGERGWDEIKDLILDIGRSKEAGLLPTFLATLRKVVVK